MSTANKIRCDSGDPEDIRKWMESQGYTMETIFHNGVLCGSYAERDPLAFAVKIGPQDPATRNIVEDLRRKEDADIASGAYKPTPCIDLETGIDLSTMAGREAWFNRKFKGE